MMNVDLTVIISGHIQILNHVYLKLISCYMLLIIFQIQKDRRTHLETLQGGPERESDLQATPVAG